MVLTEQEKKQIADHAGIRPMSYIDMVKFIRGLRLRDSDWTQLADVPESVCSKWADYRQKLRDITTQEGFPKDIVWPTQPE